MQKVTGCGLLSLINMITSLGPPKGKLLPHDMFDLTVGNLPTGVNTDAALVVLITGKAAHSALFNRLHSLAQHAKSGSAAVP